jgi:sugar transferase (PEP-CTERM/EpsH1 system associated)
VGFLKILVVTDCLPYPLISGDRIRVYNLLSRLSFHNEIWLLAFIDEKEEVVGLDDIQKIFHRVETVKLYHRHKLAYIPGLVKYGLTGIPMELTFYYSNDLFQKIRDFTSVVKFDIVQFEHSRMAIYLKALPSNLWSRSILTFHNVEYKRLNRFFDIERRPIKKIRAWLYGYMMRRWEPNYAGNFSRCIVVSETDKNFLALANPRLHLSVIPNGIDTKVYKPLPLVTNQNNLLFVGSMDYQPCIDAMQYFCSEILPRIRNKINNVNLWIVGKNPSPEVSKLDGNGVYVTGRVADVIPYYKQSAVCVTPLRAGGGTRLKILEAMALGRPVISTTIGCEGLEVEDGKHILIGDTPEIFAQQTARLLSDSKIYNHISENARKLVTEQYDWDVITEKLLRVYDQVKME